MVLEVRVSVLNGVLGSSGVFQSPSDLLCPSTCHINLSNYSTTDLTGWKLKKKENRNMRLFMKTLDG